MSSRSLMGGVGCFNPWTVGGVEKPSTHAGPERPGRLNFGLEFIRIQEGSPDSFRQLPAPKKEVAALNTYPAGQAGGDKGKAEA